MADIMTLATAATAASWLWEKIGKDVTAKAADAAKDKYQEFKWNAAAETYRAKIKTLYGKMQVMGMAESVALSEIYVDAYVLSKQTAHQRYAIEELLNRATDPEKQDKAERVGCLKLVREKGNLFILGKPGAGKTTFMKRVAFNAAEGFIDKVPIFISLKEWSDSHLELMPFIVRQFDICNFPEATLFVERLLAAGQAIVLFDGLDEVNQADGQRTKQVLAIRDFAKKFDQAQCLITCRVAANEYTFEKFVYVEMADFDDSQVDQFVKNWFRSKADIGQKFLSEFAKEENKNLRELASSPLLLTLLCLSFQETLVFPQRRVEIYEEAIDALLKKWDASRGIKRDSAYGKLSLGHKKKMFAQVAAITFEKNEYFIKKEILQKELVNYLSNVPPHEEDLDGEVLLQTIEAQHGILTARSRYYHSFSHLTFQEYFTARYIADNTMKGTLQKLLQHCTETRWREVFLLTTSLLDDASEFLISFRRMVDSLINKYADMNGFLKFVSYERSLKRLSDSIDEGLPKWIGLKTVLATALYIIYTIESDLAHARSLGLDVIFTLDRAFTSAYNCAERLRFTQLTNELTQVGVLSEELTQQEYKLFVDKLREAIDRHHELNEEIDVSENYRLRLSNYRTANYLFMDCVSLATLPRATKEEILEGLFLLPRRADENLLPE